MKTDDIVVAVAETEMAVSKTEFSDLAALELVLVGGGSGDVVV